LHEILYNQLIGNGENILGEDVVEKFYIGGKNIFLVGLNNVRDR